MRSDTDELLSEISGSGRVRRLELRVELNADVNVVWAALTESQQVSSWWDKAQIDPYLGGCVRMGDPCEINGTVTAFFPPRIFEFTWNDSPDQAARPELLDGPSKSLLRFDLIEIADGKTLLTLVQFLPSAEIVGAAAGWHQIAGEMLKSYVETGEAQEVPGRFEQLQKHYAKSGMY